MISVIVNGIYANIEEYVMGLKDFLDTHNVKYRTLSYNYGNITDTTDINIVFSGKRVIIDPTKHNILFETQNNFVRRHNNPPTDYSQFYKIVQFFIESVVASNNSIYFPYLYSKHFEGSRMQIKESIPTFYFGSMVDSRPGFIEKFNVKYIDAVRGKARDTLIHKAKLNIILNRWTNHYRLSVLHAFLIWSKGKIVFVQKTPHYEIFQDHVVEFIEENYLDLVEYWLSKDGERIDWGMSIKDDLMKNFDFNQHLPQLFADIGLSGILK